MNIIVLGLLDWRERSTWLSFKKTTFKKPNIIRFKIRNSHLQVIYRIIELESLSYKLIYLYFNFAKKGLYHLCFHLNLIKFSRIKKALLKKTLTQVLHYEIC